MNRVFIPCRINGVDGVEVPETDLVKKEGGHENDTEIAKWVEYWLNGELVHRSAHVHLKQGLTMMSDQSSFA